MESQLKFIATCENKAVTYQRLRLSSHSLAECWRNVEILWYLDVGIQLLLTGGRVLVDFHAAVSRWLREHRMQIDNYNSEDISWS